MPALGVGDARTLGTLWYTYAMAKWPASYDKFSHRCFSLLLVFSRSTLFFLYGTFLNTFLSINSPQSINHGLHLRLIWTQRLHLSHSTLLCKTPITDHYLSIGCFQQLLLERPQKTSESSWWQNLIAKAKVHRWLVDHHAPIRVIQIVTPASEVWHNTLNQAMG